MPLHLKAGDRRYELPNPGLPLGQQPVSGVAQTNPLQSLNNGFQQGMNLGFAQRQIEIEANQLAIQQQLANIQATQISQQPAAPVTLKRDISKTCKDIFSDKENMSHLSQDQISELAEDCFPGK